ncbi:MULTISPECIES: hypothetical protein [Pseudomonas]|uniref:hypothetical protein n=1 Tax=Pseudomonas TaxID=286 RepID=UPI00257F48D1|nr:MULTISPECIES: hypothetical protein [Pseudomonas]
MDVKVATLSGDAVPDYLRDKGAPYAYQVTSYDGTITIFEKGAEAAHYASKLYREVRLNRGLEDDRAV